MGLKKTKYCIVFFLILLLIVSIGVIRTINQYENALDQQIKDENGEDKRLCSITDDMIQTCTEDYVSLKRKVVAKQGKKSGIKGHFADCDKDYIKTEFGSLSGIYVCNAFLGNGGEIRFTIDSEVIKGNLKIVFTDQSNQILEVIPVDGKYEFSHLSEVGQTYYIKFIGESANFVSETSRVWNP